MAEPIAYVEVDALKVALDIADDDTSHDDDLEEIALAASRQVDDYCDRYFGQVGGDGVGDHDDPLAREFPTSGPLALIDDLVTVETVEYESGSDWVEFAATAYRIEPANAATLAPAEPYDCIKSRTDIALPARIRVTGTWGWPAVPSQITRATRLQCIRLWKSPDVALGVVGGADNMGVLRLAAALHPDARSLCDPFVKVSLG